MSIGHQDPLISENELERFATEIFAASGMPEEDAGILGRHLVWCDLRGTSHLGVRKIPQYLARLRSGATRKAAQCRVEAERGAFTVIDAADTWGQVAGMHGMRTAVAKAREHGVGVVVVRNTTSAGALGYFALHAASLGMIGVAINNSPPLQPAWGGCQPIIGNQAFGIAAPAGGDEPLLLDTATTSISLAGITEMAIAGETLPEGVALDVHGRPTTDPAVAMDGMLLPMGGHRGFGISVMWEVLTGVLAGGERFLDEVTMPGAADVPQAVSMFLLAIDPAAAMPYDVFLGRMSDLTRRIRSSTPAEGREQVRLPGERSRHLARERAANGIPLQPELARQLGAIAQDLGVQPLSVAERPMIELTTTVPVDSASSQRASQYVEPAATPHVADDDVNSGEPSGGVMTQNPSTTIDRRSRDLT